MPNYETGYEVALRWALYFCLAFILFSLLGLCYGCQTADIPVIGWRLDIVNQRQAAIDWEDPTTPNGVRRLLWLEHYVKRCLAEDIDVLDRGKGARWAVVNMLTKADRSYIDSEYSRWKFNRKGEGDDD